MSISDEDGIHDNAPKPKRRRACDEDREKTPAAPNPSNRPTKGPTCSNDIMSPSASLSARPDSHRGIRRSSRIAARANGGQK